MATINVRVDDATKNAAAKLFSELGLDTSTAINMFLRQAILHDGIPFAIEKPNATTIAAIEEGEKILADGTRTRYKNVDELWAALD